MRIDPPFQVDEDITEPLIISVRLETLKTHIIISSNHAFYLWPSYLWID